MANELTGNLKVTEAENREHDPFIFAKKVLQWPENFQARYEYNGSGYLIYAGYAAKGIATSVNAWLLQFFQYDGSNRVTSRTIAYDTWDNRAAASYS